MARFYQTSGTNYVADKMLELPYELMAQVILKRDGDVDAALEEGSTLYDALEVSSLQADTPRAREILQGYETSVDSFVEGIRENPLDYQRRLMDIRKLGRQIKSDFSSGELSAIESRYAQDSQWWQNAKELQKKDPSLYSDDYLRRLRSQNLELSGNIQYQGPGDYNSYVAGNVQGMPDLGDWVKNRLEGVLPDVQSVEQDRVSGGWIVTTKEGSRSISPAKLNEILSSSLEADVNLQNAIRQRAGLGMGGFAGAISPTGELRGSEITEVELTGQDGQTIKVPKLSFTNSILGSAFKAGIERFGFTETSESTTRTADPFALKQRDLENRRAFAQWSKDKENDYNQFSATSILTNPAGATAEEYAQNIVHIQEKMKGLKDQAKEVVKLELGGTTVPPEAEVAIDQGNFSMLYDITNPDGTPMFESGTIKGLEMAYRDEQFMMAIVQGVRQDWEDQMGEEYRKLGENTGITEQEYIQQQEPLFENHLAQNALIPIEQKFTFEGTGMEDKEITKFQKFLVESGYHLTQPLELPAGTRVNDREGRPVDVSGMSMNQMFARGILETQPIRVPKMGLVPGMTLPSTGQQISPDTYELRYSLVDGTGYIGVDVSPAGIAPATSYDDDRELELGMVINFKGNTVVAKVDSQTTTTKLKGFEKLNKGIYNTNYLLSKSSGASKVTVPGGQGMYIENAPGGAQYLKIPSGIAEDGTQQFRTENLAEPQVRQFLNNFLNR